MALFSRIGYCIIFFFLILDRLSAQNLKGLINHKDSDQDGLFFKFIPVINTLIKGLSNIVPFRGSVEEPTEIQLQTLKKYYKLSCSTYCESVYVENHWSCKYCLESVPDGVLISTFSEFIHDAAGAVVRSDNDEAIYVIFRGTTSLMNLVSDITFSYDSYPGVDGAYVHQGFYNSYQSIKDNFKPIVERTLDQYPSYKVVITGHSLGGALAIYAAVDLHESMPSKFGSNNTEVYTFGSPRVGNSVFAKYVADTGIFISRTVHKNDFVPQSPRVSQGYLHVGVESFIYEDPDHIRICTSVLESALCSNPYDIRSFIDHIDYFGMFSKCQQ